MRLLRWMDMLARASPLLTDFDVTARKTRNAV
jgi:hypothetical protein